MQVGTLAIKHLFERDVIYHVPLYQRPYVWKEEEQWQPLWEDLRRLAELLIAGKQPRAHFLGASVQDRPPVPPGQIETRLLIDGQQRLTTIQLFLKAFKDAIAGAEDKRYGFAIEKLIGNNHPLSTKAFEKFKVWPTNADRVDFQRVLETSGREALVKDYGARFNAKFVQRNIPDAYLFFHRTITEWLDEAGGGGREAKIAALYSAIRDDVRLVVIDLDEKDDAQLIFETLNARGTPLLAADLVKNSLLNEIQGLGQNAETAYQKYWQHFDDDSAFWRAEVGRGNAKRARIETFLQHALALMAGQEISAGHLYTAYRDFAADGKAGNAANQLEDFLKYGRIYKKLQEGCGSQRVRLFLERLNAMDVGTAYPFLLKLFDLLGNDEERLVPIIRDIESFLVRRMVCRLSTRGYNRVFLSLVAALDGVPKDIAAGVRNQLAQGAAEFERWPNDAEFAVAWKENALYENLTRPRLRLILEALESGMRSEFAETQLAPKNLTVEHVLPQTWQDHWPLLDGSDALERRNRLLHTIGNLTLVNASLNPHQSNKPWMNSGNTDKGKREALRASTTLYLNKALCEHEQWDEDAIEARAEALLEIAKTIWPHPDRGFSDKINPTLSWSETV